MVPLQAAGYQTFLVHNENHKKHAKTSWFGVFFMIPGANE
jgi:hypothetical protein